MGIAVMHNAPRVIRFGSLTIGTSRYCNEVGCTRMLACGVSRRVGLTAETHGDPDFIWLVVRVKQVGLTAPSRLRRYRALANLLNPNY